MDKIDISKVAVPEGYELVKITTPIDRKQQIIDLLKEIKEPTDQELIDYAKLMHPYYSLTDELNQLNG